MTEKFGTNVYAPVVAGKDTVDDMAVAYGDELGRSIHHFETESDKQAFTLSFKSRLFHSWCVVRDSSAWYEWTGTQEDGSDGDWNEIDIGGGSGGIDGITIDNKKVTSFDTGPSLEFAELQGKDTILIKPGSFEPMTAPSFLGKSNEIKVLDSGLDIRVFCNDPITPYGMYFSPDNALEGINVQEDDDRDPNLGGQLTELLGSVGFDQKAPKDGTIKLWFMYHQNGAYLPDGYVNDIQNKPLIIERAFKAGDTMKVILSGAYYAQGVEAITMHVEHSFTGESIALNPDQCLFCVNQFDEGTGTSLARIEFLRRIGVQITSEVFKFDERFAQLSIAMSGINQPETEVNAGSGEEYLSQFGINNLTKIKAEIQNGILSISDNGTDIADFYLDYLVDNTRTSMMRGKQFTMKVDVANQNSGMRMALMSWTGGKDVPSKVYDMRDGGGEISPGTGWTKVSDAFIAENPSGDLKVYELDVTIPNNSVNLAFIIYPSEAQSPMSLTVHEFAIKPNVNFTGYAEIDNYNLHEIHLTDSDEYLELGQNVQGYASLRYTLGYKPLSGYPMPMGEVIKGKAPLTLDKTRSVVAGSAARGGEGVLVAGEDGQVSISFDFLLWNEQDADTVVDFWLVLYQQGQNDGQETKISGSEMQFTVPKNSTTHGIPKIQPSFLFEIEKGQAFGLRGSANKADGAYIESTKMTDYMVKPIIDFKVISADASDDPWADIDLTQFEDVYTNSVTVTKVFHSAASALIADLPIDALVFAKAAFKHMADGSIRPVSKLDQSYKNGALTVSFGETADVMVILEVNR